MKSMRMKVPRRSNARRTQVARVACRPSLYFLLFSIHLSPSLNFLLICICSCLLLLQLLFDPFPPSKNLSSAYIPLSFLPYFVPLPPHPLSVCLSLLSCFIQRTFSVGTRIDIQLNLSLTIPLRTRAQNTIQLHFENYFHMSLASIFATIFIHRRVSRDDNTFLDFRHRPGVRIKILK